MRPRLAILALASSAALGGCAYGVGGYGSPFGGLSVGVGYGSGYGGYGGYGGYCSPYSGYGSYGLGYGGYGGYDRYGFPVGGYGYGSRYGYGYGSRYGCMDPYFGWNNGYYYPGTGYYVYDRYRRPYVWTDEQRRYWSERRQKAEAEARKQNRTLTPVWQDFNRQQAERRATRIENRNERRQAVQDRRTERRSATTSTTRTTRATATERRRERRERRDD